MDDGSIACCKKKKTQFVFQFGCKLVLVVGEAGPPPCQTKKERISQLREVAATQHRPHGPSLVDSTCMFSIIHGQLLISLKEIVQKEMVSMFVIGERYGQESESNCTENPGNRVDNFIIIILINLDIML